MAVFLGSWKQAISQLTQQFVNNAGTKKWKITEPAKIYKKVGYMGGNKFMARERGTGMRGDN